MTAAIAVSIIIPVLNEAESVGPLHAEIVQAMDSLARSYEIIFVDDGSADGTAGRIDDMITRDSRVRLIKLRRSSGQTAALAAGIEHARGRILCTMDGDLQNDPADIGMLLATLERGFDMVVGWRHSRQDELLRRRLPSLLANRLIARITRLPIHDSGCALKVFRAELVMHVPLYGDLHRFLPAMSLVAGSRITEVKVNHRPRAYGRSKYTLARTFEVLLDVALVRTLTTFAMRPIRLFAWLAFFPTLIGSSVVGYALWLFFDPDSIPSLPIAGTGTLLLSCAIMLLSYGATAELLVRLGDVKEAKIAQVTMRVIRGTGAASSA